MNYKTIVVKHHAEARALDGRHGAVGRREVYRCQLGRPATRKMALDHVPYLMHSSVRLMRRSNDASSHVLFDRERLAVRKSMTWRAQSDSAVSVSANVRSIGTKLRSRSRQACMSPVAISNHQPISSSSPLATCSRTMG
jgi:hypothetical protein